MMACIHACWPWRSIQASSSRCAAAREASDHSSGQIAVTFAVIGEIVAEFISGNTGLGYVIMVANSEMNTAMSFAALLLLSVMGLALFGIMELLERVIVPWGAEENEQILATT